MTDNLTTREKLIEAGSEVFGTLGFKSATIRKICKLAGVPVGSIHYHFGDKEGLYAAILEDIFQMAFEKYPPELGENADTAPEERLYLFIRSALYRLLGEGGVWADAGRGRLLAREFADPSPVKGKLEKKFIRPQQKQLLNIVKEFLGSDADMELLKDCVQSIIGQVLKRTRPTPFYSEKDWDTARIEKVVKTIAIFSLGGLQEVKKQLVDITDHTTKECSNECE